VTLTEAAIERVLRTSVADLEDLAWAGTHGAVASGMQSDRVHAGVRDRRRLRRDGQDLGLVGTSSMCHGTEQRVEGRPHVAVRFPGIEVGTVGGGTTLPDPARWLGLMGCAGPGPRLPPRAARRGDGARARDQRVGGDGDRRQRELLPRPLRARRDALGRPAPNAVDRRSESGIWMHHALLARTEIGVLVGAQVILREHVDVLESASSTILAAALTIT
jgi:hypothetical protein